MAWERLALFYAAAEGDNVADEVAGWLRCRKIIDTPAPVNDVKANITLNPATLSAGAEIVRPATEKRAPARFVHVTRQYSQETTEPSEPAYLSDTTGTLTEADAQGSYLDSQTQAVFSLSTLLPLLFNALGEQRPGARLDLKTLTRQISQGKSIAQFPRLRQQRWPRQLQIIVDTDETLEPYREDFKMLGDQLISLLGQASVSMIRLNDKLLAHELAFAPWSNEGSVKWERWQAPCKDTAVLILSDLGVTKGSGRKLFWRRVVQQLDRAGATRLTFSPAGRSPSWASFQSALAAPLNDAYPLPRHPKKHGFAFATPDTALLGKIWTYLSVLPLLEPALLRSLRLALNWGGSELEAQIWNHTNLAKCTVGAYLRDDLVESYRSRFESELAGTDEAKVFWGIVNEQHCNMPRGLHYLERLQRAELEQRPDPDMEAYFRRVCATQQQQPQGIGRARLAEQCATILQTLPATAWKSRQHDFLYEVFAFANEEKLRKGEWPEQLPEGFDVGRVRWLTRSEFSGEREQWCIVQANAEGAIKLVREKGTQIESPIARFEEEKGLLPRVYIFPDFFHNGLQTAESGRSFCVPQESELAIETSFHTLWLTANSRPNWASGIRHDANGLRVTLTWAGATYDIAWNSGDDSRRGSWAYPEFMGTDQHGLYADLTIKGITQRFRWIEPGTFMMGSPKDEPQRDDDREDLHQVTLTQGYWLADTTVRQALWVALMGNNPSEFKSDPQNPVEQVSWDDAKAFIGKLNAQIPGLQARLPTEAEWEYACRAGTTTPFSFGDNIDPSLVNYDGNHPYNGNAKGEYRAQTVTVKFLPANPWGLHEMHGNVLEWCEDGFQDQLGGESVSDPEGPESGTYRGLRGGSWLSNGRGARSAYRFRSTPDRRDNHFGFRLALGLELKPTESQGAVATGSVEPQPASGQTRRDDAAEREGDGAKPKNTSKMSKSPKKPKRRPK